MKLTESLYNDLLLESHNLLAIKSVQTLFGVDNFLFNTQLDLFQLEHIEIVKIGVFFEYLRIYNPDNLLKESVEKQLYFNKNNRNKETPFFGFIDNIQYLFYSQSTNSIDDCEITLRLRRKDFTEYKKTIFYF